MLTGTPLECYVLVTLRGLNVEVAEVMEEEGEGVIVEGVEVIKEGEEDTEEEEGGATEEEAAVVVVVLTTGDLRLEWRLLVNVQPLTMPDIVC